MRVKAGALDYGKMQALAGMAAVLLRQENSGLELCAPLSRRSWPKQVSRFR